MRMGMGFRTVPGEIVLVLMMLVVQVAVGMVHRLVRMLVVMALGDVQPDADRHKGSCQPEQRRRRLAEQQ